MQLWGGGGGDGWKYVPRYNLFLNYRFHRLGMGVSSFPGCSKLAICRETKRECWIFSGNRKVFLF